MRRSTLLVLAAALAQAAYLLVRVLLPRGDFGWDPAYHSLWGLKIYSDVATGRWISFAFDTYQQVYWPFLHSWLQSLAMLLLGPSVVAARVVSLAAHVVTAVVLGVLARRAAPRHSGLAMGVAVGLWLTAAAYAVRFATEAYTESLAIAVTALALLALQRAIERDAPRAFAWAGLLVMLAYFTKTDYGILLMAATLLALATRAGQPLHPARGRNLLAYALPIAILTALWFAYPPKIAATVAALINREQGPPVLSAAGALYHVQQLLFWSDSVWVFAAELVALAASLRPGKEPVERVVVVYVLVALALHTLSQTKDVKHIVKLLPWLFLLAGIQTSRLWERVRRWSRAAPAGRPRRLAAAVQAGLAALLVAAGAARATEFLEVTSQPPRSSGGTVARALVDRLAPACSNLVIGEFAEFSPHRINWMLLSRSPDAEIRPDPFMRTQSRKQRFERAVAALRERFPPISLLEPERPRTVYRVAHVFPKERQNDPTDAPLVLARLLRAQRPDRILVLGVDPGSRWDSPDYRRFIHPGSVFVRPVESLGGYRRTQTVRFEAEGIELLVFDALEAGPAAECS